MDLRLYFRTIWRFRIIVGAGLVLAILLAFLSFVKVSPTGSPKLSYRQTEDWQATQSYLISGKGFAPIDVTKAGGIKSPVSLAGLSVFFSQIATSDAVLGLMLKDGPIHGVVTASPGVNNVTELRAPLPILSISGDASSQAKAVALARRASTAFLQYVKGLQDANNTPQADRVRFPVLNSAHGAKLIGPRKKTLPIVIFLTVLTATIGVAFILENLRPRVRPLSTIDDEDDEDSRPRRSA
jgi:hypothetical protein